MNPSHLSAPPPPTAGDRRPRLPRRDEIAAATVGMVHAGSRFKSDLLEVDLGEGPMVVKDFAAKPWWVRLAGRALVARECQAYRRLGPMPSLPRFFGRVDAHAFAIEKIDGAVPLPHAADRFAHRRAYLHQVRSILDRFLALGFAHLDIRARRNVLAAPDRRVYVVDFAGWMWFPPGSLRHRLFGRCVRWHYLVVLRKWRRLLTPGRAERDEKGTLGRWWDWLRMPHRWGQERYRPSARRRRGDG